MYDRDPTVRLEVEVLLHGVVIAGGRADRFRKDVKDAGFGDGNCGFHIPISAALSSQDFSQVVVRPRGVNAYLVQPDFRQALAAVTPRMPEPQPDPTALIFETQPRFWVDRPDWFDILCARHRRGLLTDEVADQLARFVRDGIIILRRALSPWLTDLVERSVEGARQSPPDGLRMERGTVDGQLDVVRAGSGPLAPEITLVDLHAFSAAIRTGLAAPGAVAFIAGLFTETPMLAGLRTVASVSVAAAQSACAKQGALGAVLMLGRREEGHGDLGYRLGSHRAANAHDGSTDHSVYPLRRLGADRGDLVIWHPDLVLTDEGLQDAPPPGQAMLVTYRPSVRPRQ